MSTTSPSPACGPQADGSVNVEESLREQSGPNQETAALPQLVPLRVKDGCGRHSRSTSSSGNARAFWHLRFVPEADIDASLLRGVEPFQMVQLVCRAARFWIAFVQSCDP